MENFGLMKLIALRAGFKRTCAHALAALLLALLASVYGAAQVRPAARPPQQQQTGARRDSSSEEDRDADDDDESESEAKEAARTRDADPGTILRRARFVYVS